MSEEDSIGSPCEGMHKEIKKLNNKQSFLCPDGDANANQIPLEESHTERGSLIPPLLLHSSTQERIIIWGTHARSEDPELEEFELLECQEMEAFLTDREVRDHDASKERAKKDFCQRQSALTCLDPSSDLDKTDQNANHSKNTDVDQGTQPLDLRTSASRSGGRRSLRETRSNSENNVFFPAFSTVSNLSGSLASALDSAGHVQCPSSLPSKTTSDKCRFQQPATNKSHILSTQSKEQPIMRNQNHSSTVLPQDSTHERRSSTENGDCLTNRQCWSTDKGSIRQENVLSSKFQRNFERVPPSCRQLVRPLSPEMEPKLTSGHSACKDTTQGEHPSPSLDRGPKTSNHQPDLKDPVQINSNVESLSSDSGTQLNQTSTKVRSILRRQGSAENATSPLDKKSHLSRRAYSSPTRPSTPPSPKSMGSPQRRPPMSPGRTRVPARGPQLGYGASQGYGFGLRPPVKTTINTNAQNPVPQQSSTVTFPPKCPPKPKSVRPKIITYIRKSPQIKPQTADSPYEVSSLPTKLSTSTSSPNPKTPAEDPPGAPVLSASNLLYDKYRQELQKTRFMSPESMVSGTKPSSHTMPHKAMGRTNNFYGSLGNKCLTAAIGTKDLSESPTVTQESGGFLQPSRTLRPQLGVGAVSKSPSATAKSRIFTPQKSPLALSQPVQAVTPSVTAPTTSLVTPSTQSPQEASDQWKGPPAGLAVKSLLPKPAPSGLRPPGYSRIPAARLAAFGFVRSSSVSSVSSSHSTDSTRSDPCRPAHRLSSFQQSVAIDRIQRIIGVLQKPHIGEKYLPTLMQVEIMLKLWFPQVSLQATGTSVSGQLSVQGPSSSSIPPHKQKDQLHIPVKKRRLSWSKADTSPTPSPVACKCFHIKGQEKEEQSQDLSASCVPETHTDQFDRSSEEKSAPSGLRWAEPGLTWVHVTPILFPPTSCPSISVRKGGGTDFRNDRFLLTPPPVASRGSLATQDNSISSTTPCSELLMNQIQSEIVTRTEERSQCPLITEELSSLLQT